MIASQSTERRELIWFRNLSLLFALIYGALCIYRALNGTLDDGSVLVPLAFTVFGLLFDHVIKLNRRLVELEKRISTSAQQGDA